MANNLSGAIFTTTKYVELMNELIQIDENFIQGMVVIDTGSGIALMSNNEEITAFEPQILSVAHDKIEQLAMAELNSLKEKLKNK